MSLGRVFAVSLAVGVLCLLGFATLASGIAFGALESLDTRLGGYSAQAARDYFIWIEAEGLRGAYLDAFFWIDMVFPIAVMGGFASAIIGLWARPVPAVAVLGTLVALGYCIFDYLENITLRALFLGGAEAASDSALAQASLFTQLKWSAVGAALLLIASGLLLTALRGGKREGEGE